MCSFAFLRNDSTAIVVAASAIESSLTNEIIDGTCVFLLAVELGEVEDDDDDDDIESAPDFADDEMRGEGMLTDSTDVAVGGDDTPSVRRREEREARVTGFCKVHDGESGTQK